MSPGYNATLGLPIVDRKHPPCGQGEHKFFTRPGWVVVEWYAAPSGLASSYCLRYYLCTWHMPSDQSPLFAEIHQAIVRTGYNCYPRRLGSSEPQLGLASNGDRCCRVSGCTLRTQFPEAGQPRLAAVEPPDLPVGDGRSARASLRGLIHSLSDYNRDCTDNRQQSLRQHVVPTGHNRAAQC